MTALDRVLGQPMLATLGRWSTRSRLRVLAMHEVADLDRFDRQLHELLRWFRPIDSEDVVRLVHGGGSLPEASVWVTFDDGDRSVIVDAAPVLERHGIRATAFVCPGFVEGAAVPWWEVVGSALRAGLPVSVDSREYHDQSVVSRLKSVPDTERRSVVAGLPTPESLTARVVGLDDLHRWRSLGGEVANHTWDHPCLDRCTPDEQISQIERGGEWLDRHELWERRLFAYPNGDRTQTAERHLLESQYELIAWFDHALVARHPRRERVSRLRLTAGASPQRTRAVTSGWHSGLLGLRERLARREPLTHSVS